ncbi:MAG: DUF2059 domain-containing protein [Bacteroidales bacterium]|nr:DUF2059 domain-containing protein [Bacteroidales bacterium]
MKKIISILTLLLVFTTISFGQVDTNYSKTLKKMFEVSGTEESYKAIITQLITMFKQQYSDVSAEIWDELANEFVKTSLNDLVDMLVPIYKKYLTQNDLEELIKFYHTPVGKKFAKNTPLIIQESMQVGQQWGVKMGQEFEKKMKEKGY